MRIQLIILTIIIAMIITACAKKHTSSSNTNMRVASMTGAWSLTQIGEETVSVKSDDKQPNITIDTNAKTLSGYSGCNRMSGSIETLSGTSLKFGPIASTKRMCAVPIKESQFLRAFDQIVEYGTEGTQLYFLNDKDARILTFERIKIKK
jgi:heat shock protein HslJ